MPASKLPRPQDHAQLANGKLEDLAEHFSFDDEIQGIRIHRHDTPQPWINYLSNGRFHAFTSQAGGGFAWWKSPMIYRLTRYRQHNLPIDSPGFYIYIRHSDGRVWSPSFRPCNTALDHWEAIHQGGKTTFIAEKDGISAELCLYVTLDHDVLVYDLKLKNNNEQEETLDVFAYAENSQLGWQNEQLFGYYVKLQLKTWYSPEAKAVNYLFHHCDAKFPEEVPMVYLASQGEVESYSGSRHNFMGNYRDESSPLAVENGRCDNQVIACGEPASALHRSITLAPQSEERSPFFLGVAPGALVDLPKAEAQQKATLEALCKPGALDAQLEKLDTWWQEQFSAYQCEIPDAMAQRQINTWSVINSVQTGRYSRAVNQVAPGIRGVGYRDTAQDMLAVAYRRPEWALKELKMLLSYQYQDGHSVHMAQPETGELPGITLHSDDHLWPPLVAYAIVSELGDASILEQQVSFLAEDHQSQDGEASIWEHLLRAIRYTEANLGQHGLPLTMHSDWNDIIGRFNKRGQGETVFAAQQYVLALQQMVELAQYAHKEELDYLQDCERRMTAALAKHAWDGKWWLRGFDDDGNPVGSEDNREGQIFLNPQSWAVMSNTSTKEQSLQALDEAKARLDTGIGLKLLDPSYSDWKVGDTDAKMGYGPGCGENGAIFCHSNTWAVIAEAKLGRPDIAWDYFRQLIPANAMATVGIDRYRAEPYAWVSNIVGPENPHFGWANVEQITGTAPWMDVAATQHLLGVRATPKGLIIDPCLPPEWPKAKITRRFRGVTIHIEIDNLNGKGKGVSSISEIREQLHEDGSSSSERNTGLSIVQGHAFIDAASLEGRQELKLRLSLG